MDYAEQIEEVGVKNPRWLAGDLEWTIDIDILILWLIPSSRSSGPETGRPEPARLVWQQPHVCRGNFMAHKAAWTSEPNIK